MYIQSQHKFDKQPRGIYNILVLRTLCCRVKSVHVKHILYSSKVFIKIYFELFFIIKRKKYSF